MRNLLAAIMLTRSKKPSECFILTSMWHLLRYLLQLITDAGPELF